MAPRLTRTVKAAVSTPAPLPSAGAAGSDPLAGGMETAAWRTGTAPAPGEPTSSAGGWLPQRQVVTVRGTRRPQDGHVHRSVTGLNSAIAVFSVRRGGRVMTQA